MVAEASLPGYAALVHSVRYERPFHRIAKM
jgi:hypothetical protein